MNAKTFFILFLYTIFIESCAPFSTQVVTPISDSEAYLMNPIVITLTQATHDKVEVFYPPCETINNNHIPTPNAGCMFTANIPDVSARIDLGNSYQVKTLTPINDNNSLVTIINDSEEIYKIKIRRLTYSGLVAAWGYDNHWAIEVAAQNGFDIIQDGESIRAKNNYDQACGFQILDGKPFYFFKKSGFGYGVNYDGSESYLDYDKIVCSNENPNADPHVIHYQNVVEFAVEQNGVWKYAIVTTLEP